MGRTLTEISRELSDGLGSLQFSPPVTHVYNPLEYARAPHENYLQRYGDGPKEAVFLGMNPGPWGMAQTGIPFGEVTLTRDFLGISGQVTRPVVEHPKRPVEGFDCRTSEGSGRRFWGFVQERFAGPEAFFDRYFVINYCPLLLLQEGGQNLPLNKLPAADLAPVASACDRALRDVISRLSPRLVIGIGRWAEARAKIALATDGPEVGYLSHPSPASPVANAGWAALAERQLEEMGLHLPA